MQKKTTTYHASGVPVYCAHDAIVAAAGLKPNPKNPNQHPEEQIRLLAKIITEQGWRQPITVSTLSGYIVKGHGRLMAAQKAGLEEAPVDYQDYPSEAAEYADLIADNRLAELAEIDEDKLAGLLSELDLDSLDIELTGFTDDEYNELLKNANGGGGIPS